MSFDLLDVVEKMAKKIETLEVGKLYELSIERDGENGKVVLTKIYYIKECLIDGSYKVVLSNICSNWSDQMAILHKKSTRKYRPELDMLSIDFKNIRELSQRESKTFVDKNLKSWPIREKFGLKPIKRRTPLGHVEEVRYN